MVSQEERETLKTFVRTHRVKGRTSIRHHHAFGMWSQWLLHVHGSDDKYLRGVADPATKADLVALFYVHAYEHGGMRGVAHANMCAGVRRCFEAELEDTGFLDLVAPRTIRASTQRTTAEARAYAKAGTQRAKLPLPGEAEDALRALYHEGRSGDSWAGRHALTTYVAYRWGESHGLRASNIVAPGRGEEDHCLRAEDVVFKVKASDGFPAVLVPAHALPPDTPADGVVGVTSHVWTHKRGAMDPAKRAKPTNRSTSAERSELVDLVLQHSLRMGPHLQASDPFFTTYRQNPGGARVFRRVLRRKDLSDAVKAAATKVGLPPRLFSSSSLRKTHACKAGLLGPAALAEAAHRAGWATDAAGQSRTVARHYNVTGGAAGDAIPPLVPAPGGYRSHDRPRIPIEYVVGLVPPTAQPEAREEATAQTLRAKRSRPARSPSPRKRVGKRTKRVMFPAVDEEPPRRTGPRTPTSYVNRP